MLTRVYIDNFRGFVNFEYKPERKQLLLGANGTGKSSLLEAIRYVQQFVNGVDNPFTQSTRTRWQDRPVQVVEIEARLDEQNFLYRVEIQLLQRTGQMSVKLESLTVAARPVFELANGKIAFFNESGESTTVPFETELSALHLSRLSNSHVRRFLEWFELVHCFRIDAYPGVMDEKADSEERHPQYEMDNLAGWYRHLVAAYPDRNAVYLDSLRVALDGFQTLRFSSDEKGVRELRADFTAPTKKRASYSLSELSEGQRCLIALYMILQFELAKGHTVFIDEPDNFIALREIQPWLLAAEEAVEDHHAQLILISHHPEILNQWASEYGLRFFREENGQIRTEKFRVDRDLQPSELIARGWEG